MQRRTFLKLCTGAVLGSAMAACGGAHDGSANLEPEPQPAPAAPGGNDATPVAGRVSGKGG
ncbi:MAG: hypothetical protein JWQ01_1115 [Massilia sp.]|jgi:hypothetical protein|nr:hypothetical protein [Massilia sp.]